MHLLASKRKKKKAEQKEEEKKQGNSGPKRAAGALRLQIDFQDLNLPEMCKLEVPNKEKIQTFYILIQPDKGYWKDHQYKFKFVVPDDYPHKPPKVTLNKPPSCYHPNIDVGGAVCLNLLKEGWKPILTITQIVFGLLFLFTDPNPSDPLNHEAAESLRTNKAAFAKKVQSVYKYGHNSRR